MSFYCCILSYRLGGSTSNCAVRREWDEQRLCRLTFDVSTISLFLPCFRSADVDPIDSMNSQKYDSLPSSPRIGVSLRSLDGDQTSGAD